MAEIARIPMTGHACRSLALFCILMASFLTLPVAAGLNITDGRIITSRTGESSPVFTVTGTDIPAGGTIIIDVSYIQGLVANGTFTDGNVRISDTAGNATWTGEVSGSNLTLMSVGGNTVIGENLTVTFSGKLAGYSAWIPITSSPVRIHPEVTRTDTDEHTNFTFRLETTLGTGNLEIEPGKPITTPGGSTVMKITVTGEPMHQNDTILMDVSEIDRFVSTGSLTEENLMIGDTSKRAAWTYTLDSGALFLVSSGGGTRPGENISVTFTGGAGSPWKPGTGGNRTVILNPVRMDTGRSAEFSYRIDIPPPSGYNITTDFAAAPTTGIAPLKVFFADRSSGQPAAWDWDFGDGTANGTARNPVHMYMDPGIYYVSLTASNNYSHHAITKYRFVTALNGGVNRTNTTISGLVINGCEGVETIIVNTSVLPADLIPDKFTLEIRPPADRGLKNITIWAQDGIGFTRNGSLISGNPTRVHLESENFSPPNGFSPGIGTASSFSFSADLPQYPCNAQIVTTIREGILPEHEQKLLQIASGQTPVAVPIGTAYTATLNRINFPGDIPVMIRGNVNSSWNTQALDQGPGSVFFWRVSENGTAGQILPTSLVWNDSANRIDYYHAASPSGMSTFGLSSFTGNNNPFQLITLTVAAYFQPESTVEQPGPTDAAPVITAKAAPTTQEVHNTSGTVLVGQRPVTVPLYTGSNAVLTQTAALTSPDRYLTVLVPAGTTARDRNGRPLDSIALIPLAILPAQPEAAFAFTGHAYELTPDQASFSPSIQLSFTIPPGSGFGQKFVVMAFNRETSRWEEVPAVNNATGGAINAQVQRFCCYALFTLKDVDITPVVSARSVATAAMPAPTAPSDAMTITAGLIRWFIRLLSENLLAVLSVAVVIVVFLVFEWHRRNRWK